MKNERIIKSFVVGRSLVVTYAPLRTKNMLQLSSPALYTVSPLVNRTTKVQQDFSLVTLSRELLDISLVPRLISQATGAAEFLVSNIEP